MKQAIGQCISLLPEEWTLAFDQLPDLPQPLVYGLGDCRGQCIICGWRSAYPASSAVQPQFLALSLESPQSSWKSVQNFRAGALLGIDNK